MSATLQPFRYRLASTVMILRKLLAKMLLECPVIVVFRTVTPYCKFAFPKSISVAVEAVARDLRSSVAST